MLHEKNSVFGVALDSRDYRDDQNENDGDFSFSGRRTRFVVLNPW